MITKEQMASILANDWELVRITPEDVVTLCDSLDYIANRMQQKWYENLVGFEKNDDVYEPVFTEQVQREWDESLNGYITAKARWCEKYGAN